MCLCSSQNVNSCLDESGEKMFDRLRLALIEEAPKHGSLALYFL